jgi:alkyldihydroxyacetonephosphate synthase
LWFSGIALDYFQTKQPKKSKIFCKNICEIHIFTKKQYIIMKLTYRDILKWGNKEEQTLDYEVKELVKEAFGADDEIFSKKYLSGETEINIPKSKLSDEITADFEGIAGKENVRTDDESRANFAHGKFYGELLELRKERIASPPDAVISPKNSEDVRKIIKLCNEKQIPIVPSGGRSSVTRGVECPQGGIALDLTKHLNQIIEINETDQTVRVQSGMYGPELEKALNARGYTCGHFPQSFEYSTVGGWIAAKGAGQESTGYGKIEDLTVALKAETTAGTINTAEYPKNAQGWDIFPLFIGSEGTLGVITEASLKIFKHRPKNTAHAAFAFKSFESAVEAMRQMIQSENGKPHLFRISDPQETDVAFKTKGFDGSAGDRVLKFLGYKPGSRCLMFISVKGDKSYTRLVKRKFKKIAKQYRGFYIGKKPVKQWLEQRFSGSYMRDPLMDLGLMTDTLETSVTWGKLLKVWKATRDYADSRPKTIFMIHISHVYENGANLYFTFISPMEKGKEREDFENFYQGLVNTIIQNGGSLSHHHGVGRTLGPRMENRIGKTAMNAMRAIKIYFDPANIMNPGGMLGLD